MSENSVTKRTEEESQGVGTYELVGEYEGQREENVKQFRLSDGTCMAVYYAEPVHYEREGAWADIDNRLTLREAVYVNAANSLMVELPRQFEAESRVSATIKGHTLRFGIAMGGAEDARPISGEEAKLIPSPESNNPAMRAVSASVSGLSYAAVAPGAELRYHLRGDTLKESFLFADAASTPEIVSYTIEAGKLCASRQEDGGVVFSDETGGVFYLRAPYLTDAAGERSAAVAVTLEDLGEGAYRLVYTPERAWLEEPGRAWPVTLDPVISGRAQSGYLLDCHVCSNYPTNNYTGNWVMPVGHDSTRGNMRLFVRWTGLPSLGNMDVVVNAFIELEGQTQGSGATVSAYMTTGTWATPTLTWNNKPGYNSRVLDYRVVNSSTRQIYTWDITAAAKLWYAGEQTNYGVVFISNKENTSGNDYGEFFSVEDPNTTPPALEIQYRKIVGLEDYWTRREVSVDRAGTAYIGDSNGLLTVAENDVYYASTSCPVTISHFYNTAYAGGQIHQTAPGGATFSTMQMGVGWKLNIQQTVTAFSSDMLQYLDGDGSVHYFPKTATNTYKDEDGLGLTITASGSNYTMTDRYGNIKYFGSGKLRYLQDASGNRINCVYDSYDNRVNSVTRQLNGGTAETIATLSYNSIGVLTKITDGAGKETSYSYASGYKLTGLTRPDGTTVSYTYDSNGQMLTAKDNETLYSLTFTYDSRGLISGYSEKGNTTDGAAVAVSGTVGIRNYRSSGKDRVLNNADDLITSYVFDYYGRTICSSTRSADGKLIYSASTDRYSTNSGTSLSNNRLKINGMVGMRPVGNTGSYTFTSPNLLTNGDMSGTGGWTLTGASYVTDSTYGHAAKISGAVSSTKTVSQAVTVNTAGAQTYMLSAWAKAGSVALTESSRTYELRATVKYSDNTTEVHTSPFCADSAEWQYNVLPIVPKSPTKTVSTITVAFTFNNNPNTAYFTYACLTKEPAQSYTYNSNGDLTSVTTPDNATPTFSYSGADLITAVTQGNGTMSYTYDSAHRVTGASNDGLSMGVTYSGVGNTTGTTLTGTGTSSKITSSATYDSSGNRLTKVTDARGKSTQYAYGTAISQQLGTPTSVTDAKSTVVSKTYNASNGRVTGTSLGSTVSLGYTYGNGLLTALTRTAGSVTQSYNMTYDSFGRMLTLKVGTRSLASYSYAAHDGLLSSITYSNGQSVSYAYDNLERVTGVYYNGSSSPSVSYAYKGEGTLGQRTDHAAGQVTQYTYDRLGRLLSLTEKTSGNTAIAAGSYTYDTANRLTQRSYQVSPSWNGTYTTANTYGYTYSSSNGALTGLTIPGGSFAYTYDALKRLTARTLSSGGSTVFAHNYSYLAGSGTNVTTTLVSGLTVKRGSTTLASFGYSYDNVGNITAITGTGAASYTYDAQGQLTKEVRGGVTYSYSYNGAGNLTSKTKSSGSGTDSYTYGDGQWKDLLTAYNGTSITYDNLGNPTKWYDGATMTWVNGRRLASIGATSAHSAMSFTYDPDGLRLTKTVGSTQHKYVWVNGKLVSEQYGTTTLEFAYDESGRPASLLYNGTRYYYVTNLQGDVVKIVNATGTSAAEYSYNAWGEVVSATGTLASVNPLRYRGYYYDTESSLYYLKSRYYDPKPCRFINADSLSSTGHGFIGCNMFAYCGNNPVNCRDSDGYRPKWIDDILRAGKAIVSDIKDLMESAKEQTKDNNGAYAFGGCVFVGCGVGVGLNAGCVLDERGNVGIIISPSTGGSMLTASAGAFLSLTNASDIYSLGGKLGSTVATGFSVGDIYGAGAGVDALIISDPKKPHKVSTGLTIQGGLSAKFPVPFEVHELVAGGDVYGFNLFDSIIMFCDAILGN